MHQNILDKNVGLQLTKILQDKQCLTTSIRCHLLQLLPPKREPQEQGATRVGVDYKSPITITITVPIKLSITITITVVIEKVITITITIIRLRLQLLVYHGNDSRLFIRHVGLHLQYYHA